MTNYDDMTEDELRKEWGEDYPDQYIGDRIITILDARVKELQKKLLEKHSLITELQNKVFVMHLNGNNK